MIRIGFWAAIALLLAVGCWALFAASTSAPPPPPQAAVLPPPVASEGEPFVDRFIEHRRDIWNISGGWANGPYMVNDWRRSQTQIDNGLRVVLQEQRGEDYPYTSGEVQSRVLYGYGYYETVMQAAKGSGLVSGFFTYTGPPFGRPWNEIDVEILGRNTREAALTYHYAGDSRARTVPLDFDAAEAMHHYAFDWQRGHIRWYIDGALVHEERGESLPLPNEGQKIMMHLWGTQRSPEWAGPFDPAAAPATMTIGCVAYSRDRSAGDRCR